MTERQLIISGSWLKQAIHDKLEADNKDWLMSVGLPAAHRAAQKHAYVTTDDVREEIALMGAEIPGFGERKGSILGALMRMASSSLCYWNGRYQIPFLAPTGQMITSKRGVTHARKITVWQSLIYRGA